MPAAVATSDSEMPVITVAGPPVPPASTSSPRSLKDRMMPATVPKRPTKGVIAPMVPRIQKPRFMRKSDSLSARSTTASRVGPVVREARSNPARKISAATALERSAAERAAARSPFNRWRPIVWPSALAWALTPHRAISRSIATPRDKTEPSRITTMVTPPKRTRWSSSSKLMDVGGS